LDATLLICLVATLGVALVADFSADNGLEVMGDTIGNVCVFRECFGIPCPFCGMSRSIVAFTHGHIVKSFLFHPLGPAIAISFAAFAVVAARSLLCRGRSAVESSVFNRIFMLLAVVSLVLWAIRVFTHSVPSATSMVSK
jgi:hypothetical protein